MYLSTVCTVYCLYCLLFVPVYCLYLSSVCTCLPFVCLSFECLAFVLSSVCVSTVGSSTECFCWWFVAGLTVFVCGVHIHTLFIGPLTIHTYVASLLASQTYNMHVKKMPESENSILLNAYINCSNSCTIGICSFELLEYDTLLYFADECLIYDL